MTILPVILDSRPAIPGGGLRSLLTLPLVDGTLLSYLLRHLGVVSREPPVLIANSREEGFGACLRDAAREAPVRILEPARFAAWVGTVEPSDWILMLDARYANFAPHAARLLPRANDGAGASYVVATNLHEPAAREFVRTDERGFVRRVQRYYGGITHRRAAGVVCALVPAAVMHFLPGAAPESLDELRARLAAAGSVGPDLPADVEILDLHCVSELLAFHEAETRAALLGDASSSRAHGCDVRTGVGCCIDPSARLVGPLVLHDDVRVEADALLVGPTVIGRGARIGAGAAVVQCLLADDAQVAPGAELLHALHAGGSGDDHLFLAAHLHLPIDPGADVWRYADDSGDEPARRGRGAYGRAKVAVDALLAAISLILLSPLLALLALLVKLDSRGPVFFAHVREGLGGRRFNCWKFRTMQPDAHARQRQLEDANAVDGPQFKIQNDPRVTHIGRWLRAMNLDELPQLWNVLLGEMSLIGPRPSPFRENQICVPWRTARLSVRPGITGLWQVCRHDRDAGDFHQWIHYDMLYVRHFSLWLDIKILLATVLTLGGKFSVPESWIVPRTRRNPPRAVAGTEPGRLLPANGAPPAACENGAP